MFETWNKNLKPRIKYTYSTFPSYDIYPVFVLLKMLLPILIILPTLLFIFFTSISLYWSYSCLHWWYEWLYQWHRCSHICFESSTLHSSSPSYAPILHPIFLYNLLVVPVMIQLLFPMSLHTFQPILILHNAQELHIILYMIKLLCNVWFSLEGLSWSLKACCFQWVVAQIIEMQGNYQTWFDAYESSPRLYIFYFDWK